MKNDKSAGKQISISLRKLADFYVKYPSTPEPLIVLNAPQDPPEAIEFLRAVGGKQVIKKSYSSDTCEIESTTFPRGITISIPHKALYDLRSDIGVDISIKAMNKWDL